MLYNAWLHCHYSWFLYSIEKFWVYFIGVCDFCLLLEILALTKMSLMCLSFLNVMIIDMFSCIDLGTHFKAYVGWDEVWMEYIDRATYGCIKLYKEDEVNRVRCACIHVLMHVHIIIKVWDCKRSDWDTHRGNTRSYIFVCDYQMCVQ